MSQQDHNWPGNRRLPTIALRFILTFLCATIIDSGRLHAAVPDAIPWELNPYRVRVFIAFDTPQQAQHSRSQVITETRQSADRCIGSHWQVSVEQVNWLQPVGVEGLSRLSESLVLGRLPESERVDAVFVATIRSSGAAWRIDVRCWQPELHLESDCLGDEVLDRRDISLALLRLCHKTFRPIGRVDGVDGKQATIVLRGGALRVPDDSFSLAHEARTMTPLLAMRKKDKSIDRVQVIPWTYLAAGDQKEGRLDCTVFSGLRSAIGGKQRGRVETLAVAVKSTVASTQLELATQSKPSIPLAAYRIEVRDSAGIPPADSKEKDEHLLQTFLTDRRGHVSLPAKANPSVVWVFAYSGRHLLARVPIVPGIAPKMRLEVPDDSARLEAEAELYMLQGQLIEAVAARNTCISRVRAAIKKNDLASAKSLEAEMRKLPDAQVYLERVTAIRVPSIKAAKARRDRAGEARINRMCDDMNDLIRQYLNEDKRHAVSEELKELRADEAADKQQAGGKSK